MVKLFFLGFWVKYRTIYKLNFLGGLVFEYNQIVSKGRIHVHSTLSHLHILDYSLIVSVILAS